MNKLRIELQPGPVAKNGTTKIYVPEIRYYYWFKTPAKKWAYYRLTEAHPKKVSSRNKDPIQAVYAHCKIDGLDEIDIHDKEHNRDLLVFLRWYKRKYG